MKCIFFDVELRRISENKLRKDINFLLSFILSLKEQFGTNSEIKHSDV